MATKKAKTKITGDDIAAHIRGTILAPADRLEQVAVRIVARAGELNTSYHTADTTQLLDEAHDDVDVDDLAARVAGAVAAAAEARRQADANRATAEALKSEARSVRARAEGVRKEAHEAVIGYLSDQMNTLVEDVRALAETHPRLLTLTEVQDAPALLAPSQEQGRVLGVYRAIREAQRAAYRTVAGGDSAGWTHTLARSGLLRDAIDAEGHWLDERRRIGSSRAMLAERCGGSNNRAARWFTDPPAIPWQATRVGQLAPTDDVWSWLVWATENAEPFVPSIDELNEADRANHALLSRPPTTHDTLGRFAGRR